MLRGRNSYSVQCFFVVEEIVFTGLRVSYWREKCIYERKCHDTSVMSVELQPSVFFTETA